MMMIMLHRAQIANVVVHVWMESERTPDHGSRHEWNHFTEEVNTLIGYSLNKISQLNNWKAVTYPFSVNHCR